MNNTKKRCRCYLLNIQDRCVEKTGHNTQICSNCRLPGGCAAAGRKLVKQKKAPVLV